MDLFDIAVARKLAGGSGGGGGSSDFSTAQVTFMSTIDDWGVSTPLPSAFGNSFELGECSYADITVSPSENLSPYTVIMYKGKCIAPLYTDNNISVSGDATYNDGLLTITGDCTITIS